MSELIANPIVSEIKSVVDNAKHNMVTQINNELIQTYWHIGEIIVKHEQNNEERVKYGEYTLKQLSKELTAEFGKGFSIANLQNMRKFYSKNKKER